MKPKVIISSSVRNKLFETLNDIAEVRYSSFQKTEEFLRELEDAVAIIIGPEPVGEDLLERTPKLKVIARHGVGYDAVDVEACTKREVYVTHTPGVLSAAVAELTMGLMLCLSRNIVYADHYVRTEWAEQKKALLHYGVDLASKILGIIGLGRIGYEVAQRARAFNMSLVYYDTIRKEEAEKELKIQYLSLDDLLKTSDFVTIHVPLTANTTCIIGEKELKLMKKTAYLINTSRGPTIDETVLCKALEETWIAGAALDVFEKEPLPFESTLINMKNVVLTPHIGSFTIETRHAMVLSCIENIRKVLQGEVPPDLVPEQKGKIFKK